MGKSPPEMAKKACDLVKVVLYMMRRGVSKSKHTLHICNLLLKRGKSASRAISCRSDDVLASFISPREYEFSCSNSPAYSSRHSRRKNIRELYDHSRCYGYRFRDREMVFDVLTRRDAASPLMALPPVRQLRVTDSPFEVDDHRTTSSEESDEVDRDAERFIKRFYRDLRNQSRIAALWESPSSTDHI